MITNHKSITIDYKINKYTSKLNYYLELKKVQTGSSQSNMCKNNCGRTINLNARAGTQTCCGACAGGTGHTLECTSRFVQSITNNNNNNQQMQPRQTFQLYNTLDQVYKTPLSDEISVKIIALRLFPHIDIENIHTNAQPPHIHATVMLTLSTPSHNNTICTFNRGFLTDLSTYISSRGELLVILGNLEKGNSGDYISIVTGQLDELRKNVYSLITEYLNKKYNNNIPCDIISFAKNTTHFTLIKGIKIAPSQNQINNGIKKFNTINNKTHKFELFYY